MSTATYEIWADWFQYCEEGKGLTNATVTKALAAAGDYAEEDVLSESAGAGTAWTFSDIVKSNGCSGEITKAQAICETTGLTPRLTLYLFTATPTSQLNDNVANTALLHADLANYVGKIDFPAMEDLGGDSESLASPSTYGNLPLAFTCASGANDLYGILVTRDAITGEVATMDMTINLTCEQSYLGEDLTSDVTSIHFGRGKSDELGKAEVGQLSITLNNNSGNYSPSYSSGDYYGYLKPKRVIGVRAYDDDYDYQLFYGYVEEIIPHPHLSEQNAIITAVDGLDHLSRHDMATALYKDSKTGTIHDYILTDAGWLRLARLDDGQDTVPYWYGHDIKARFAQEEIDDSEQGFSYIDGFGYFNFEDRYHRSSAEHQTSQATFDNTMSGMTYSLNPKNVYNIIKVTVTPFELQAEAELWRLKETPSIPIGETLTWWGEASVSGESVFVDAWVTPASTTDYTANSQSDGLGTDMTANISITTTKFAETIKLDIINNGTVPAYITLLKARGTYYNPQTKVTRKAEDTTSQGDYQKRTLEIDGKYMTDADLAQDLANYAIGKYKEPRAEISMTIMNSNEDVFIYGTKYENYIYYTTWYKESVMASNWFAQTFTPSVTHTVNAVKLKLYRMGTPNTLTVSIKATDGSGNPTGDDLCSGTINGNIVTTNQAGLWYLVDFGNGTNITASTVYAIVVRKSGGNDYNYIGWISDTSASYSGGHAHQSTDAGDSWANCPSSDDFLFEEWNYSTSTMLAQILNREISDRITVINDKLEIAGQDFFIDSMEHNISMGGLLHTVTYKLADCINEDFWCLDYSVLSGSSTFGQTKLSY